MTHPNKDSPKPRDDGKKMVAALQDGVLHIEWPSTVSTETLLFMEELLTLQLRSVRKMIEGRKNEGQIPLELTGALIGENHG
jgi:hypothetical protein